MAGPAAGKAAPVVIVGDTRLQPVAEMVSGIKESLGPGPAVVAPAEAEGRLGEIVAREGARAVIALGRDAIDQALRLPPEITVIYDMVILPPRTSRPNTTGLYMATPVSEYVHLIRKYLPELKRISVVSSLEILRALGAGTDGEVETLAAASPYDFVSAVRRLDEADALLLLPDVSLLTTTAMEETYLYSFRERVPLLGISEKHVRKGALFALVFNAEQVGRDLGQRAALALAGTDVGSLPPAPSSTFDLYINIETARKMGITIPTDMMRTAKAVFP